ncbi:hypothetical protein [Castellaniella defragrans]|uniref:hypothetical protein n=1 Tax=Castellaniella defragrans TaxID=75697 RepID=UPI00124547FE|nr:hypothetical protein [Castellaniella defragrans]
MRKESGKHQTMVFFAAARDEEMARMTTSKRLSFKNIFLCIMEIQNVLDVFSEERGLGARGRRAERPNHKDQLPGSSALIWIKIA